MSQENQNVQNQNEQNAQVQNNKPSKMKKVFGVVKKGLMIGGLVAGGAYLEHKTGIVGKTINKFKKNNNESAQRTFQVRHDFQNQKGGQR